MVDADGALRGRLDGSKGVAGNGGEWKGRQAAGTRVGYVLGLAGDRGVCSWQSWTKDL